MRRVRSSSWQAAPAGTSFRRWPWRGVLRERSCEVVWLGTRRGLEARVVPARAHRHRVAFDRRPARQGRAHLARGAGCAWRLRCAQALAVMRRHRPLVVVGLGGFVTGPGGVAAWLTRRPLLIHEQNAIAGFTNRCLARLAREVLEAFPGSFGAEHRGAHRSAIRCARTSAALAPPAARFADRERRDSPPGAGRQPGRCAPQCGGAVCAGAPGSGSIRWSAPPGRASAGSRARAPELRAALACAQRVAAFIDDMAEAYDWADLVICRAGALTVSRARRAPASAPFWCPSRRRSTIIRAPTRPSCVRARARRC